MATRWTASRSSWWSCPLRRWRATCWRWGSSAGGGRGCTEPWSGPAAPWLALWTRWAPPPPPPLRPPPRPVLPRRRAPSPPHLQSPPCWARTRLQNEPFCKKKKKKKKMRKTTDWRYSSRDGKTYSKEKEWGVKIYAGEKKHPPLIRWQLFERRDSPKVADASLHIHEKKNTDYIIQSANILGGKNHPCTSRGIRWTRCTASSSLLRGALRSAVGNF